MDEENNVNDTSSSLDINLLRAYIKYAKSSISPRLSI